MYPQQRVHSVSRLFSHTVSTVLFFPVPPKGMLDTEHDESDSSDESVEYDYVDPGIVFARQPNYVHTGYCFETS